MCGIVYAKDFRTNKASRKGVNFKVIELYKKQRARGHQGFGYYAPETDRFVHNTEEKRIIRLLSKEHGAKEILFHHRMPTSTGNIHKACHPFSTRLATGKALKHTYIGVHNGVLRNEHMLKHDHKARGIDYVSLDNVKFNDSEALVYELALFIEGKKPTFDAAGSMAWILMELDEQHKPVKLHFGHNSGNPLKIHRKHNKFLVLSSLGPGESTIPDKHYVMDYRTGEYTKTDMEMQLNTAYHSGGEWNPTTRTYEREEATRPMGFQTSTSPTGAGTPTTTKITSHDYPIPNPSIINVSMAGHRYQNGEYDPSGKWHPLERPALPAPATPALDAARFVKEPGFFSTAERVEYSTAITDDAIDNVVGSILSAADFDAKTAAGVVAAKLKKAIEQANVMKMQMEGTGPLMLEPKEFDNLSERVWAAEADVYIYEEAMDRLRGLSVDDLAERWAAEETTREERERVGVR